MSSSGVGIADLKGVSLRGRMGYAIAALESAASSFGASGTPWEDVRERLWRCVVGPPAEWAFARLPLTLSDVDDLFTEQPARWDEARDVLRQVLHLVSETRTRIVTEPVRGYCDGSHDAVRSMAVLLRRERIEEPPIDRFIRSPFSESSGWGRPVPPAFFRDGVEREGWELWLRAAIGSESVHRAREATHALCHLGLPSETLREALMGRLWAEVPASTRRSKRHRPSFSRRRDDAEVVFFAETAVDQYRTGKPHPDEPCVHWPFVATNPPTQILTQTAAEALADRAAMTVIDFASRDAALRARAADRASTLLSLFPQFIEHLARFVADDSSHEVRTAAAASLSRAPASDRVIAALTAATRDPHVAVRAAAARSLGRMGPAAAGSLRDLLTLMGDRTSEIDTTEAAFEASEAIEEIGVAAVPGLVDEALRGDDTRRAAAIRKLVQVDAMRASARERLLPMAEAGDEVARELHEALAPKTPPPPQQPD